MSCHPKFQVLSPADCGSINGRNIANDGSKLDGIEAGATADQTAAQILAALLTVDGAGSGLNADLLDGYTSATAATADTIALRNNSGDLTARYVFSSYLNMSHGAATRSSDSVFYSSTDDYLRKNNASGMRTSLNVPTRTGGDASGTWGISITGSAGTLDGIDSTSFLRSDTADSLGAALTVNDNIKVSFGSGADVDFYYTGTYMYTDFPTTAREWFIRDGTANRFTFQVDNGEFTATGNITAFSDIRVKENIELIQRPIDKVKQINGYTYNRTDIESDERYVGVVAQEVEKVLPEVVSEDDDGMKSVAYGNMVGLLVEAIKEQQKQIDALTARINTLEG